MYSNASCNSLTHYNGGTAAILVSSVLASLLGVTLIVCILIYKYRHTLSVLAFIYMPRYTRRRTEKWSRARSVLLYMMIGRGVLVYG